MNAAEQIIIIGRPLVAGIPATALVWGSGNALVWGTGNYLTWG